MNAVLDEHRSPASAAEAALLYQQRCSKLDIERSRLSKRSSLTANIRFVVFLTAASAALAAFFARVDVSRWSTVLLVAAVLLVGLFLVLVGVHRGITRQLEHVTTLWAVNDEAAKRVNRRWEELPAPATPPISPDHPYADDLDLLGRASLLQLLGSAKTALGLGTLQRWLLEPTQDPVEIRERQDAVRDLSPRLDLRQRLEAAARVMGTTSAVQLETFFTWAEGDPWLAKRRWLIPLSWLLAASAVTLLVLHVTGAVGAAYWGIPVLINLGLTWRFRDAVHGIFERGARCEQAFQQYAVMLRQVEEEEFAADNLRDSSASLRGDSVDRPAHREMWRLHQRLALSNLRLSQIHIVVQALVLWDFHVLALLERWQTRCGARARRWLEVLGYVEALSALAEVAHDNPAWSFPDVATDAPAEFDATALGHPLLRDDLRVVNDVRVGPPGTFMLVTGSNMSGKSTLLRAIGINVVLAQAGGPVCATKLRLSPTRLFSSMPVRDSLARGVSHFMAGLLRLKAIVEAAREAQAADGGPQVLYLFDELLQGTNSAEREVAVRNVICEMLSLGTIGAITTHDLAVAEMPELTAAMRPVHFSETIEDAPGDGGESVTTMSFDYKLQPGVATSRNALRLMEIMGMGRRQQ